MMKKIKKILYPICAVIILFAMWNLWEIRSSTEKTEELYTELAEQAGEKRAAVDKKESAAAQLINPWLDELKKQNPDLVGWIRIPDTVIDYPVMQTETDNDFYMDHDFDRNENAHGALFLDVNCRIGKAENLIIYGHHMKDGTMFQNLMKYKEAEFCENNGTIRFDTPEESAVYQVIFVMLLSEKDAEKFPYYKCTDLSDQEIYQGFLTQCSRYAIWQSEDLPSPGTRLLTLSTCEYSSENGRLVVVAKHL